MTAYIGVDFHARQQTISYLTTEDGEIQRLQLDHGKPEEVRRFYGQFAGQRVVVGFESSGRAAWFENTVVKLAIFAILQALGPMLSDVRIAQIATLTQF
jgi:hypothetical protein